MPDFLLELFSEEIPARMQAKGAEDLLAALRAELGAVTPADASVFYGARRIGLVLTGLPEATESRTIETRGPRVGAPEAALAGFLRGAGLASVAQCEQRDTGKGVFYFAVRTEPGRPIRDVLAEAVPLALDRLVWPKSMRWAGHDVRWVRPLRNILAILYGAGHETEIVPAAWRLDRGPGSDGAALHANDLTFGHRFLAPAPIRVASADEHKSALADRFVLIDATERKARILADGARLAAAQGMRLRDDPGLLDEVAGLVEWPVVRLGRIEPSFMSLPPEVLTTSMRSHQKYFALETADGVLAPWFMVVANNEASDGGARIVAGNERVLRARLSDARFFWEQDTQRPLGSRVDRLAERVFHAKLGSVKDKVDRIVVLADWLADKIGADRTLTARAAFLAKADLSTSLVGEFPELQGVMGRYLALHDDEDPRVAEAVALHYAPVGASDAVPTTPLAMVVALADKLDTLAAFFAVGELPTGSKDPFALRRAALGVMRIIRENGIDMSPYWALYQALETIPAAKPAKEAAHGLLLDFFYDRVKVALRDEGVRHDLIAAVFAKAPREELLRLLKRVEALQQLVASEDGANLLVAYRRACNILGIEERKDGVSYADTPPEPARFVQDEERVLAENLAAIDRMSTASLAANDFYAATVALARLRRPVDDFFEQVTVNVAEPDVRANRLRLLAQIRHALDRVADFSKIEG